MRFILLLAILMISEAILIAADKNIADMIGPESMKYYSIIMFIMFVVDGIEFINGLGNGKR